MTAILPVSVAAEDKGAAILHSNQGVLVNRSAVPATSTLFPGDAVETQPGTVAKVEVTGSDIDIDAETVVEYEGDEIVLEHGRVSVNTSRGFKVRVGCVMVMPANPAWTRYVVTDTDGKVTVAALKNDVNFDSRSANPQPAKRSANAGRVSVRQGEQSSREKKCGAANIKAARAAAQNGILDSPYSIGAAVGAAGVLTCVALCHGDDPISPSSPRR